MNAISLFRLLMLMEYEKISHWSMDIIDLLHSISPLQTSKRGTVDKTEYKDLSQVTFPHYCPQTTAEEEGGRTRRNYLKDKSNYLGFHGGG